MIIKNVEINYYKKVIWGTGKISSLGFLMLKDMDIKIDYFCDSNPERWGKIIADDIICVPFDELKKENNIFYFIMTGKENELEIIKKLHKYTYKYIGFYDLLNTNDVIDLYFDKGKKFTSHNNSYISYNGKKVENINNKKGVIYTCITGKYDKALEPVYKDDEIFDYFIISDIKPINKGKWTWIDAKHIIPSRIKDNIRRNRYCKINGIKIFSQYQYSIYIDGNIQIIGDLKWAIESIPNSGIALFSHPLHDCLYVEALICLNKKYGNKKEIYSQINQYRKAGMPRNYGQFECGFLARENNNRNCIKLMDDWWNEVQKFSYRDQISFMYCVWKNGIGKEDIGDLGSDLRESSCIRYLGSHHQ